MCHSIESFKQKKSSRFVTWKCVKFLTQNQVTFSLHIISMWSKFKLVSKRKMILCQKLHLWKTIDAFTNWFWFLPSRKNQEKSEKNEKNQKRKISRWCSELTSVPSGLKLRRVLISTAILIFGCSRVCVCRCRFLKRK